MAIKDYTREVGPVRAVQWTGSNEAELLELLGEVPAAKDSTIKSFVQDEKFCLFYNQNKYPMYTEDWLVLDNGGYYVLSKSQFAQVFVDIPRIAIAQKAEADARERPPVVAEPAG